MRQGLITGEKTPQQLDDMRECGRILAKIFRELRAHVTAGMSEVEIDQWVSDKITSYGAEATYKTAEVDFPGVICISVNDQIVHSVPSEYVLEKGDVVSFDMVISYRGMKTDSAFTMIVDEEPKGVKKHLLNTTRRSLYAGIDAISGPVYTGDIGAAIEQVLSAGKLGIIRDLVGHGVGLQMHMPPDVPNYGRKRGGVLLNPGETIAIEPMATLGGEQTCSRIDDGWTISTKDGSLAAHFEHTILITEVGAEVLTLDDGDPL